MKAIDTNVLVRIITTDDKRQASQALHFIKTNAPVYVSLLVLMELSWVLLSCYDFTKKELIDSFETVLKTVQLKVEASETVWQALIRYQADKIDFSDCLISADLSAKGCVETVTFDKRAAKTGCFELL